MATRINVNGLGSVPCKSVTQALELLKNARVQGLRASYHPCGGDTQKRMIPASHTLWVMGEPDLVRNFCQNQNPAVVQA